MLILLVEDDPLIALMAEDMLCTAGHDVLVARTGEEALSAFQDTDASPDAIILDNRLPDMLGWDVAEQCRALAPQLPIVMCSGDTGTGARDLDRLVVLHKPYREQQLLDALAQAVEMGDAGSSIDPQAPD